MSKYALVFWINSNSTSVVPSTAVTDRDMLGDPEKIGKILAAVPGKKQPANGWKKHDGRVICTHDKLQVLKVKEDSFIKESEPENDLATGRGHRHTKHKRFLAEESDDQSEFSEEEQAVATSKHVSAKKVKRAQAEGIISLLKEKQQVMHQPSSCKNCRRLEEEVAVLKEENLALLKGLPGILSELGGLVRNIKSANRTPSRQVSVSPAPPTQTVTRRPSSSSPSPVAEIESLCNDSTQHDLGGGISLPVDIMRRCQNTDYKRMIRDLMSALFTQEQMSHCSVFGKKGFGIRMELRQPLPVNKVEAIINYVRKHFPAVDTSQINQTMAYKLKDVRKATSKSTS